MKKKVNGSKIRVFNDVLSTTELTKETEDLKKEDLQNEKIVVSQEDAAKVKTLEIAVLRSKVELADLVTQIQDLKNREQFLLNTVKNGKDELISAIRVLAKSYGIDPDGILDDKKWNLNTSEMVFYRVK
jgi:hypothetical protein